MRPVPVLLLALLPFASCRDRSANETTVDTTLVFRSFPPPAPGAPTLHITIARDGMIYADGRRVTYQVLDSLFAALKTAHGEVWIYDGELAGSRQTSAAQSALMKVGTAIVKHELPNKFSHKPDFSDLKAEVHD